MSSTLLIIGTLMWLFEAYVPLAQPYKKIIQIVVLICTVVYVLTAFGVLQSADIPVPQLRRR